jgi:hypothetical protein
MWRSPGAAKKGLAEWNPKRELPSRTKYATWLGLYDEDGDLVGPDGAAAATALVLKAKTAAAEGPTKQ